MSKPINILIADDEKDLRKYLVHVLSTHPSQKIITEAENGKEAVELTQRNNFDLILLDVRMPEMTGLEALDEIMKNTRRCYCCNDHCPRKCQRRSIGNQKGCLQLFGKNLLIKTMLLIFMKRL